jgi:hypothetical protein
MSKLCLGWNPKMNKRIKNYECTKKIEYNNTF